METLLKKETYKEVEISYKVDENGLFTAEALGLTSITTLNKINPNCKVGLSKLIPKEGFITLKFAEEDIKEQITDFLSITPHNYGDLARKIEETLVWTNHEDCYVDEFILKTLVENFIKYKSWKEKGVEVVV